MSFRDFQRTGPLFGAVLGTLALAPLALVLALAPGLSAVAATPAPGLDRAVETSDPLDALDRELTLLADEVAELQTLLVETERPELARRIGAHLANLQARRDVLLRALAAEEKE